MRGRLIVSEEPVRHRHYSRLRRKLLTRVPLVLGGVVTGGLFVSLPSTQEALAQTPRCDPAASTGCPLMLTMPPGPPASVLKSGSDLHLWRLTVPTSGRFVAFLGWSGAADLDLYVQDPGGQIVGESTRDGGVQGERVEVEASSPGEYRLYVQVNPSRDRTIQNVGYSLMSWASREIWAAVAPPDGGRILASHLDDVGSIAFSPDGQLLATGSSDRTAALWRVHDGQLVRILAGHTSFVHAVAFSDDGQLLVTASSDKTARIWRVADGEPLLTLAGHGLRLNSVAFSPNGLLVATGSSDKTARIWRVSDGELVRTLAAPEGAVSTVKFSPDGQYLGARVGNKLVRIWTTSGGDEVRTLTGPETISSDFAFSPNGDLLVTGSTTLPQLQATVRLWRVSSGEMIRELSGHRAAIVSVAFSPDGQLVASGSSDRTVRLWRASDAEPLRTLTGARQAVWSVAFSPDSLSVAASAGDGAVRLWGLA